MANPKRWVRRVKTESTFPPRQVFTKEPRTIARVMASRKVSPKGIGSGIRMIQYFINRAGRTLSATRRRKLEKGKEILQTKREHLNRAGKRSAKRTSRSKARSARAKS